MEVFEPVESSSASSSFDASTLDSLSFDEIVADCVSPSDVISMFVQLRNSTIPEEEQMNHLYMVMRNPMVVECIDELIDMFMDAVDSHRAITHVLDGWQDGWTLDPSDHTKLYAQPTLVKKLKDSFIKLIGKFGDKDISQSYYGILQNDFMICLFHSG
jgi:hypothetical protein